MSNKSIEQKLAKHQDILGQVLDELRMVLTMVLNEKSNIIELMPTIEKLRTVRQIINNTEDIGLVIGVHSWHVAGFPLPGDTEKDLNQLQTKIPKNKIN